NTQTQRQRREDPAIRAVENARNTQTQRQRREDPAVRAVENTSNSQTQRQRREDPAIRAAESVRDRGRYQQQVAANQAVPWHDIAGTF
ncbi:hypothetical protein LPJ54_002921, partial [Coemansia sp. RSA 1824]